MKKTALIERDICSMFITPASIKMGWDNWTQMSFPSSEHLWNKYHEKDVKQSKEEAGLLMNAEAFQIREEEESVL
jgi:hypothetical protein